MRNGDKAGIGVTGEFTMLILEFLLALAVAILLSFVLVYPLRRRGPGPFEGLIFFFLILFLAAWAGGVWVRPIGPTAWNVSWVGFLLVGLIIALILASAFPSRRPIVNPPADTTTETEAEVAVVTLGVFFFILLFAMLAAIILHYIYLW